MRFDTARRRSYYYFSGSINYGDSGRSALSGSTFAACRHGIMQASIATAISNNAIIPIVGGSIGVTSYSWLAISRVKANAPTMPNKSP